MKGLPLIIGLLSCVSLSSCFKEEPLNAECDIQTVTLHVNNPLQIFYNLSDTLQDVASNDSIITFSVRHNHHADLSQLIPKLITTPGAKVTKRGGKVDPHEGGRLYYRITSEDGMWHRDYSIVFEKVVKTVKDTIRYDFEHYELEKTEERYYVWYELSDDGTRKNDWANGNPGFRLSRESAKPEEYPTAPLTAGYSGAGIRLTTCSTGPMGELIGKRIAAGNFFLGTFNLANALRDPLTATMFGKPFDRQPLELNGYYKYNPGKEYKDKNGNTIPNKTDKAAIYAVFYLNHDKNGNPVVLNGNNVESSPHIVAFAEVKLLPATTAWTTFSAKFNYRQSIDVDILDNRGYNLAIVFSSSKRGAFFEGAVGSELCIDKVSVPCSKNE